MCCGVSCALGLAKQCSCVQFVQAVIEEQIYPNLSSGFSDENAYIRELTLKSMLTLAPKLKQSTLTQNLLKHLSRLQVCILA